MRSDSLKAMVKVKSLDLEDRYAQETCFPKIISKVASKETDLLQIEFEQNPLDKHADIVVSLKQEPIDIIINKFTLERVAKFFTPPPSAENLTSDIKNKANETINSLSDLTKAQLEDAINSHKTIDLYLQIAAPTVIIPEDPTRKDSLLLVLDLGKLVLQSDLQPIEKLSKSKSDSTIERKESDYYDKFNLSLSNVKVLLVPSNTGHLWRDSQFQKENRLQLIQDFNINLHLENCIQPNEVTLTKLKFSGDLPEFKISFSSKKYHQLMSLVKAFTNDEASMVTTSPQQTSEISSYAAPVVVPNSDKQQLQKEILVKRKILEAEFKIPKISIEIKKESDGIERDLILFEVKNIIAKMTQRTYDIQASINLHEITIQDLFQGDSKFLYLLSSSLALEEDQDLISFEFKQVQKESPEYKGVEVSAQLTFDALYFCFNEKTIVALIEFGLKDLAPQKQQPESKQTKIGPVSTKPPQTVKPKKIKPRSDTKFNVNVTFKTFGFLLNQNGNLLAEFDINEIDLQVKMYEQTLMAEGKLHDISILNMDPNTENHYSTILSVQREKEESMLEFSFCTFSELEEGYPGYDSSLKAEMRSLEFVFLNSFVMELQSYFLEGPVLAALSNTSPNTQSEKIQEETDAIAKINRIKLDVKINSPHIIIPRNDKSNERFYIDLGVFHVTNTFQQEKPIENLNLQLNSININAFFNSNDRITKSKMLKEFTIDLKVERLLDLSLNKEVPQFKIRAQITQINLWLSEMQLNLLIGILNENLGAKPDTIDSKETRQPSPPATKEIEQQKSEQDYTGTKEVKAEINAMIKQITFQILRGDGSTLDVIATFNMNQMNSSIRQQINSNLQLNFSLHSIELIDDRIESKNQFKNLLSFSCDPQRDSTKNLIDMKYKSEKQNQEINLVINYPSAILVADALYTIKDFFMNALSKLQSNQQNTAQKSDEITVNPPVGNLKAIIEINQPEILMLHDPTKKDTRAIIMKTSLFINYEKDSEKKISSEEATQIEVEETADIIISRLEAFVCRPGIDYKDALPIIKPFTLKIEYYSNSKNSLDAKINIDSIILLFSYQDFRMIMAILESIKPPATSTTELESNVKQDGPQNAPSLLPPHEFVVQEKFNISCPCISLNFINDFQGRNIPLAHFRVCDFTITANNWSSKLNATTNFVLQASYFNNNIVEFEPLLEIWKFQADVNSDKNPQMSIEVSSNEILNLNVSHAFIDTLGNIVDILNKDYYAIDSSQESTEILYSPYWVVNETEIELHLQCEKVHLKVAPGQRKSFSFSEQVLKVKDEIYEYL